MRIMVTDFDCLDNTKPCEGATYEAFIRIDVRSTDDPAKIPAYKGSVEPWFSEGRNHRVEGSQIRRDLDDKAWFIRVDSLKKLASLLKEYQGAHVKASWSNEDILELVLSE